MANRLLILFLLITGVSCTNQTYDQVITDCANQYQSPVTGDATDFESVMNAKVDQLRDCIRGQKFPSFRVTSLTGKEYTDNELEGKVVLINLWFATCSPCVAEIPLLNELHEEFKSKGFVLIGLSTDDSESIKKFLLQRKITYDVFPDSHELITKTFKLDYGYPTNIFLNKKGEIVEFKTGGSIDEAGLRETKEAFRQIILNELAK